MAQADNNHVAGYCVNCGAALKEESKFCAKCGAPVAVKPKKAEEKQKSSLLIAIVSLVVVAFVVGFAAGGGKSEVDKTREENTEAETISAPDYSAQAEAYLANGNYYEAMKIIDTCWTECPESTQAEECDELALQIEEKLLANEPENGETLERTFQYQGSCVLRTIAQSGPAEITVRDKENPEEFVRFYVREGESAEINLTGGLYVIEYKIGYLWFNDEIGFGEFCYEDRFDEDFDFDITQDNAWISSSVWAITV